MFTIMIVDDEPELLNSMREAIEWSKYGFEMPICCQDTREAIAWWQDQYVPDVLITDICMPNENGLALIRYARERGYDMIVVILSGHDEFSFAQEAIKLQAYDYILKPVTPQRFQQILQKIGEKLYERQWCDVRDTIKIAESNFLNLLWTGSVDAGVIEENKRNCQMEISGDVFVAAILDVDPPLQSEEDYEESNELMRYGLFNVAHELLAFQDDIFVFQGKEGLTHLLIIANTEKEAVERAKSAIRQVFDALAIYFRQTVSAGVGDVVGALWELYKSASGAEESLNARFYYGGGNILTTDQVYIVAGAKLPFGEIERAFEQAVHDYDCERALEILADMFRRMREIRLPSAQCVQYSQRLVTLLLRFSVGIAEGDEFQLLEEAWIQTDLYGLVLLSHMLSAVCRFCEQVFERLALVCDESARAQVSKAENYIRLNYANPKLSLQMVTDHLAVSTSYFSSLFKTRTGLTFVEYLTKVRMEKARQMLTYTDRRTYEIAEDVGFSDPHYFSVVFKRTVRLTPKEYREQSRKEV